MSETKAAAPRTFRAWPENEERLAFAKRIGLDVTELVNEVLAKGLKPVLEQKAKKIREAVTAPVP